MVLNQRESLLKILCRAKIKAIFAGHVYKSDYYDTCCSGCHKISVITDGGLHHKPAESQHIILVKVYKDKSWEKEIIDVKTEK